MFPPEQATVRKPDDNDCAHTDVWFLLLAAASHPGFDALIVWFQIVVHEATPLTKSQTLHPLNGLTSLQFSNPSKLPCCLPPGRDAPRLASDATAWMPVPTVTVEGFHNVSSVIELAPEIVSGATVLI